jgi:aryl-alcohol dehydrogenase-like predicted oxidoreductase
LLNTSSRYENAPTWKLGLHASVVGLGTWVLGGGTGWGRDTPTTREYMAELTFRGASHAGCADTLGPNDVSFVPLCKA